MYYMEAWKTISIYGISIGIYVHSYLILSDLTSQPKKLLCDGEKGATDCLIDVATNICTKKVLQTGQHD
jgi:hypothetical protein